MKKFLSLTLALAMLGTALTGCSSKDAASLTSAESTQQTAPVRQEQSQAEKALALINTFATGDTDTARSLLADGYIQHNLAYGTGTGAADAGSTAFLLVLLNVITELGIHQSIITILTAFFEVFCPKELLVDTIFEQFLTDVVEVRHPLGGFRRQIFWKHPLPVC